MNTSSLVNQLEINYEQADFDIVYAQFSKMSKERQAEIENIKLTFIPRDPSIKHSKSQYKIEFPNCRPSYCSSQTWTHLTTLKQHWQEQQKSIAKQGHHLKDNYGIVSDKLSASMQELESSKQTNKELESLLYVKGKEQENNVKRLQENNKRLQENNKRLKELEENNKELWRLLEEEKKAEQEELAMLTQMVRQLKNEKLELEQHYQQLDDKCNIYYNRIGLLQEEVELYSKDLKTDARLIKYLSDEAKELRGEKQVMKAKIEQLETENKEQKVLIEELYEVIGD